VTVILRKACLKIIPSVAGQPKIKFTLVIPATHQDVENQFIHRLTTAATRDFIMWHGHICDFHCGPRTLVFFLIRRSQVAGDFKTRFRFTLIADEVGICLPADSVKRTAGRQPG
jgi:hypothetical protein